MAEPQPTSPPATHFRWAVFALSCGTSWFLYVHRYTFGLIKPMLAEEFALGNDDLGWLDTAFSLSYQAAQIPVGIAVDVAGVHLVLTAMILLWSSGLGMHAWATKTQLAWLWAGRIVLGLGQSATFAALSRITRTWFPSASRTTVQGWVGVFFGRFGGVSAYLLVGCLMLALLGFSWQTAVMLLAVAGVIHGLAFAVLFRNLPRLHPWVNESEREVIEDDPDPPGKGRTGLREMIGGMSLRSLANLACLNLQTLLSTLSDNIFSAWIPLFLYDVHGLKVRGPDRDIWELSLYSSLPLLGGALGGAFGGWLNDRLIHSTGNRRWTRSGVGMAGKGTAGVLLVVSVLFFYDDPLWFCVMLFIVKFFSDWSLVTTWGSVTDIGGRATASVFALNNTIAITGSVIAGLLYGYVSEYSGWSYVFYTGAGAYLACALSWLFFNSTIPVWREKP